MSLRRIAGAVASAPAAGRAQDVDRYQHPSRTNSNEFATGQQPLLSGYEDDGMVARNQQDYGAIERPGSSSRRSSRRASPEFHRSGSTLNIVPEEEHARPYNVVEEPEEMEYDLEERGLYSGECAGICPCINLTLHIRRLLPKNGGDVHIRPSNITRIVGVIEPSSGLVLEDKHTKASTTFTVFPSAATRAASLSVVVVIRLSPASSTLRHHILRVTPPFSAVVHHRIQHRIRLLIQPVTTGFTPDPACARRCCTQKTYMARPSISHCMVARARVGDCRCGGWHRPKLLSDCAISQCHGTRRASPRATCWRRWHRKSNTALGLLLTGNPPTKSAPRRPKIGLGGS